MYALRNVNKAASRPNRAVKRCELVIVRRNDRTEIFLQQLRMLTQSRIRIREDNPLLLQILLHAVVYDLRFILSRYPCKKLLLCFRDAELVEGFFDFGRNLFPCLSLLLGRLNIILDVVEIQIAQVATPIRIRHFVELLQ
ncbi:hypothetical protein D3C80_1679500 [compost metagenome]